MRQKIINTFIDNISMDECIKYIEKFINDGHYHYIVTPNVDHIVKLDSDKEFQKVYKNADLVLADGMPLIWYSKIIGKPLKEKISGSDLFPKICELSNEKDYKIFLLGAGPGVAAKAATKLKEKYKNLKIVGYYSPPFGFEKNEDEIEKIIKIVNKARPDILAVGLGAPKQEKFIFNYRNRLKVPVCLAIGATIDFESGTIKRSPKWLQKMGLEWLYRLINNPKRMFKRYLIDDIKIIQLIFISLVNKDY